MFINVYTKTKVCITYMENACGQKIRKLTLHTRDDDESN